MSQSKIQPRHKLNHMLPSLSVIFPTNQLSFDWYTDCKQFISHETRIIKWSKMTKDDHLIDHK